MQIGLLVIYLKFMKMIIPSNIKQNTLDQINFRNTDEGLVPEMRIWSIF